MTAWDIQIHIVVSAPCKVLKDWDIQSILLEKKLFLIGINLIEGSLTHLNTQLEDPSY